MRLEMPQSARFFRPTAIWAGGLFTVVFATDLMTMVPAMGVGTSWSGIQFVAKSLGLFLPLAAFAGGVGISGTASGRAVSLRAFLIVLISFCLLAYVNPLSEVRIAESRGFDVSERFPMGPTTPRGLLLQREAIQASPPTDFSFSVNRPLSTPPNWLTYLLHSLFALPAFSILAALLGQKTGMLTSGLSPPSRKNARWALGLFTGGVFVFVLTAAGIWVRMDPSRSGVLGAWAPHLIPLLELGLLSGLLRYRRSQGGRAASVANQ
jgi:hypothetical protein